MCLTVYTVCADTSFQKRKNITVTFKLIYLDKIQNPEGYTFETICFTTEKFWDWRNVISSVFDLFMFTLKKKKKKKKNNKKTKQTKKTKNAFTST